MTYRWRAALCLVISGTLCWGVRLCSTNVCLGFVKVYCAGTQTLNADLCYTGGAPHSALWYLAIYAGVSGFQIVFQLSSTLLLKILSLAAARSMHNSMLKALLRLVFSNCHAYAKPIKSMNFPPFFSLGTRFFIQGLGFLGALL